MENEIKELDSFQANLKNQLSKKGKCLLIEQSPEIIGQIKDLNAIPSNRFVQTFNMNELPS